MDKVGIRTTGIPVVDVDSVAEAARARTEQALNLKNTSEQTRDLLVLTYSEYERTLRIPVYTVIIV